MRPIRFLLFVLLSFTVTCAWADIAPRPPGPRRPWKPPPLEKSDTLKGGAVQAQKSTAPQSSVGPQAQGSDTRVSMAAAKVQVRIRNMEAAPGTGEKGMGLLADVTGEFDMECLAAPEEGEDLQIVFPIAYAGEKPPGLSTSLSQSMENLPRM